MKTGNEKVNELLAPGLPAGVFSSVDKLVDVQEMNERAVVSEDEAVQKVVSGGSDHVLPLIAPGQRSDEAVSLKSVDRLVISDTKWKDSDTLQTVSRAKRQLQLHTLDEQMNRVSLLIRRRVHAREFDAIHGRVVSALTTLQQDFDIKESQDKDFQAGTDQKGSILAARFLLKIMVIEKEARHKGASERMNGPHATLEDDGIPRLFWTSSIREMHNGRGDFITFSFYGDGDIIMLYHFDREGGVTGMTAATLKFVDADIRKAYAMILEFGGKPDAA